MGQLFNRFGFFLVRLVMMLHYRVRLTGRADIEKFQRLGGGTVIGMGHVSYEDPVLVSTQLARFGIHVRPVVHFKMYDRFRWMMKRIGAFRFGSLSDGTSDWMKFKIRRGVDAAASAVANGETILIYPSGQTKGQLEESLGGKTAAYDIVSRNKDKPVLVVNIYGLFGSLVSRYWTDGGRVPSVAHIREMFRQHPWLFLWHVVLRRVKPELDFQLVDVSHCSSAVELNALLDDIYHQKQDKVIPGREKLKIDFQYDNAQAAQLADAALDPAVTARVKEYLAEEYGRDAESIQLTDDLVHDLDLDSLELGNLKLWIEEEFKDGAGNPVKVADDAQMDTVGDLIAAAQGLLQEVGEDIGSETPDGWVTEGRLPPAFPSGAKSIPQAFIATARRMGWNTPAFADETSDPKVLTYRDVYLRAILLARKLRASPGTRVGMLLPASAGAATVLLAANIARKSVVPPNWTSTKAIRDMEHALAITEADTMYTSEKFLDKAAVPLSDELAEKIVVLEEVKDGISWWDKIVGLVLARCGTLTLRYFGSYNVGLDDEAVVLFTSGSEKNPKAVPLTHGNILSNVDGALEAIGGKADEVVLGFQPVFHSFGLTLVTAMSITCGVRAIFEANALKYKRIVSVATKWKATIMAGTPDILAAILSAAESVGPDQLSSIDTVISGAQAAPQSLVSTVRGLGAQFLEGYGITETSPLVSITRPGEERIGVGRSIKGTEVLIVDLDTHEPKPEGEKGLIMVSGPGVFGGYLGDEASPFLTVAGRRCYNTGDLGYLQGDSLVINGRLKRSRKFAGEMISLGSIENTLMAAFPSDEDGPRIAVDAGPDREGKPPVIALFTRDESVTLEDANRVLKAEGFKSHCYISVVIAIDAIPMLGSGKIAHNNLPKPVELLEAA